MKKYNSVIFISIILYVFIAITLFYHLTHTEKEKSNGYRIEINRIMNSLTTKDDLEKWDSQSYEWINGVTFLKLNSKSEEMKQFFEEQNNYEITIYPWYIDNELVGYLKFTYPFSNDSSNKIIWITQFSLFILEIFILIILLYMKRRIIRPFHQVSSLPYELARGRLKGEVKIEKGKYFKNFLWGISSLKDTLDHSKKKELEFMREKQQMLLSLSHDMKTPINIIKLYVKSLEENLYQEKEEQLKVIHQIGIKTSEMEQYVEQITKSSREEIIDLPVIEEEFYLSDLLSKILPIYDEQCNIQNIELNVSEHHNFLMKADMNRCQEVLENILENAIKYGDGRKIEITFSEEEYHHLIHISNTGTPVSENEFNHLFDSFFRGKNAKGKAGSGLGLYICRELMNKMGGTIYAEMKEDEMSFILVFK